MNKYYIYITYKNGEVKRSTHYWNDNDIIEYYKEFISEQDDVQCVEIYKEFAVLLQKEA